MSSPGLMGQARVHTWAQHPWKRLAAAVPDVHPEGSAGGFPSQQGVNSAREMSIKDELPTSQGWGRCVPSPGASYKLSIGILRSPQGCRELRKMAGAAARSPLDQKEGMEAE